MDKQYYCYILASGFKGTLYIGVTSNLVSRVYQHKEGLCEGFTKKYGVHQLVWYEIHSKVDTAIQREKQMKKWNREWIIQLIESMNPGWRDLYSDILGDGELDSRFRGNDNRAGQTSNSVLGDDNGADVGAEQALNDFCGNDSFRVADDNSAVVTV